MLTPLEYADDAVYRALTGYSGLTALVAAARIRQFDRTVDLRQIDQPTTVPSQIWIVPVESPIETMYGGERVQWILKYEIGHYARSVNMDDIRPVQYEVMRALLYMSRWLTWTSGGASAALATEFSVSPFAWDTVTVKGCDPRREPAVPSDRWRSMFEVTCNLVANVGDVITV